MNIATARKKRGWTQQQLAAAIGVSRGAVAQYEMQDGTYPAPDRARKLLDALPELTWASIYAPKERRTSEAA